MASSPFWLPSSNKLVVFIISCIFLYMLFVENKFFFFFLITLRRLMKKVYMTCQKFQNEYVRKLLV